MPTHLRLDERPCSKCVGDIDMALVLGRISSVLGAVTLIGAATAFRVARTTRKAPRRKSVGGRTVLAEVAGWQVESAAGAVTESVHSCNLTIEYR